MGDAIVFKEPQNDGFSVCFLSSGSLRDDLGRLCGNRWV